MKRKLVFLLSLAVTAMLIACTASTESASKPAAASPSASPAENIEQVIAKLEQEWVDIIMKNDIAGYDRIEADDYIFIASDGRISNKAQDLADAKANAYKPTKLTISNLKVRVYGETAVGTGTSDEQGTYKGKDTSGHYLYTDVWVKRNGKWQVVSTQGTKVEPPKK